jgi:hypothetical protein
MLKTIQIYYEWYVGKKKGEYRLGEEAENSKAKVKG